ncbi:MAG: 2-hydroxyglutaryl-CoA dehydratase [Candidatus Lokiarchaeota archaeon]|nr:2-hydroxyglutaryl-CoA dehydratase [Candidatus Lokiarchaeota archaeon]
MARDKDISIDRNENLYLGIDVGSVSTKFAIINENMELLYSTWARSQGSPIHSVQDGFKNMRDAFDNSADLESQIKAVGTTGSARYLTKALVGGDIAKTEIIAHGVAASYFVPGVRTILEIGGQDSKVILMENGIITDFAMNSICAAGTGSFLDHQAHRLGIPIEEFGERAEKSKTDVVIAGRCTVFAETDMIHKQQMGHSKNDIIKGLCNSLVRNYLNNVCKGKKLLPPITFQGGVAANSGIVRAFEKELGHEIIVHKNFLTMGAIGAAMLSREHVYLNDISTNFKGFDVGDMTFTPNSFNCSDCPNQCEITYVEDDRGEIIARWGDRCGKWTI